MNSNTDPDNESSPPSPAGLPNWEERLVSDLRRVCPDWDGAQRRTVVRILRAWGGWLHSPQEVDGLSAGLEEVAWLPLWWIERCPFMAPERLRRCLRFFAGLWSVRRAPFNEQIHALADLRKERAAIRQDRSSRFAALRHWRAAA